MRLNQIIACFLLTAFATLSCQMSYAGIQALATRVVYGSEAKAATLSINNNSAVPYMVQTWLEDPLKGHSSENLPIVVVPPLLKLEANRETVLRFIYAGRGLPTDKETLFWINIQEIPPTSQEQNTLQVAIKTRLKLFYRPKEINATLETAIKQLQWSVSNGQLKLFNPSPLHITIGTLQLNGQGQKLAQLNQDMVGPNQTITVLNKLSGSLSTVNFTYINDYGGESDSLSQTIKK